MIITAEKKVTALVAILAIVAVIIIVVVIFPTIRDIQQMNKNTHNLRVYLEENYEKTKHLRGTRQQVAETKESIAAFNDYLIKRGDELKIITALENIAAENKIKFKIDNSNLDTVKNNTIRFTVNASGEYLQLIRFLSEIESSPYFLITRQLQWTPTITRESENPTSYNMSIIFSAYVSD